MAVGISALVLGVECLAVERVVMKQKQEVKAKSLFDPASYGFSQPQAKVYDIPEWAPWSLLSGGAILMLYTLAASKQQS